jgi:tetratricopeptide (TPR) repeat protein
MKLSQFSAIKWERARDLKKKGAYPEAEKELKEALDQQPEHFLLKVSLAELYLRQDRLVEARILSEAILSSDPSYAQALFVLGEIFFKEKKFDKALQCFHLAQQKDTSQYLTVRVAKTLREMERFNEALEIIDSVLVKESDNLRFLREKAMLLNRMNRPEEALKIYEKVYKLDPKDYFVRKEIYRLKGLKRPDEKTIEELEKVTKLSSQKDDAHLHGFLGLKLKKAGKLKEALSEFQTARQLAPEDFYFLKLEGFCHYQMGDYDEAIEDLSQVFRKDPNQYIVRKTLKKMYVTKGNLDEFIVLLEQVINDHPHNVKLFGILKGIKKEADVK